MDAGCHAYSMVTVPLYDTLGPDAVRYICGHAEVAAVACSFAVLPVMLQCLDDCPTVKLLVGVLLAAALDRTAIACLFRRSPCRAHGRVETDRNVAGL